MSTRNLIENESLDSSCGEEDRRTEKESKDDPPLLLVLDEKRPPAGSRILGNTSRVAASSGLAAGNPRKVLPASERGHPGESWVFRKRRCQRDSPPRSYMRPAVTAWSQQHESLIGGLPNEEDTKCQNAMVTSENLMVDICQEKEKTRSDVAWAGREHGKGYCV